MLKKQPNMIWFISFNLLNGSKCSATRCFKITRKVSFNMASEASYIYILSGQKLLKKVKNSQFWRVFENLSTGCSQTVLPDRSLLIKNVSFEVYWIFAFSTNFCHIKNDMSGNTVWPQAIGFQKIAKFLAFLTNFCPLEKM